MVIVAEAVAATAIPAARRMKRFDFMRTTPTDYREAECHGKTFFPAAHKEPGPETDFPFRPDGLAGTEKDLLPAATGQV
jgi:hypothetical protein